MNLRSQTIGFALLVLACTSQLRSAAATFTWQPTAAGNFSWTNAANWSGDVPNVAGAVADTTINITGDQTITLDAAITVGILRLGDAGTGTESAFTLNNGASGSSLKFETGDATDPLLRIVGNGLNTVGASLTLAGNLDINFSDTSQGTVAIGGQINETGGSHSIIVQGGNVTLSGNNSFTGGITVQNDATVLVGHSSALGTGTLNLSGGSTRARIRATAGDNITVNNSVSLAGNGELILGGGSGNSLTLAGSVSLPNNKTFLYDSSGSVTTISGVIDDGAAASQLTFGQGSGSFRFGQINLTGANTFDGGVNLISGVLGVGNNDSLGTGTLTFNGGSIAAIGDPTINNSLAVSGDIFVTSGQVTFTAPFTLGGNNRIFTVDSGATATFSGAISSSQSITKEGTGTLVLGGANTYSGGTVINAGTVSINANGNLGATSGGLTFGGGTLLTTAGITSSRDITLNAGGGTFDNNGFDSTLSGLISGAGALTKAGTGSLTLAGINTYSGGTIIKGGTVNISADGNLGATAGGVAFGGGTLLTTAGITSSRDITLNAGGGTFDNNGFDSTLSGVISGAGALTKAGAGSLTLAGINTYSGNTIVNGGTLSADSATALGNTAGILLNGGTLQLRANLSFASAPSVTLAGGALDANNHTATFGALTLSANSTFKLVDDSTAASLSLESGSWSAGSLTVNGWANTLTRDSIFITSTPSDNFLAAIQFTGFAAGAHVVNGELAPAGVTPVPEPTSWALIGVGAGAMLLISRRRLSQQRRSACPCDRRTAGRREGERPAWAQKSLVCWSIDC